MSINPMLSLSPIPAGSAAPGVPIIAGMLHRPDVRPLTDRQVCFEIDMCVGCDRCMLACPVPFSSRVTIAELNASTIADDLTPLSPLVAQFTEACIMCGSCVPVCPVNNHRDLLMLSLKQRLGNSWDRPADTYSLQTQLPPGWNMTTLYQRLREQPLLRNTHALPDLHLLHLASASRLVLSGQGETLYNEAEYDRNLYLILDGQITLSSRSTDASDVALAVYRRGEYLGDQSMLTGLPHDATARAEMPSVLLIVPEQVMQRLMELHPDIRHHFEQAGYQYALAHQLRRLPMFTGIAESDMNWLLSQTHVRLYDRNDMLFQEDGQAQPMRETLHLILDGFVKVARSTRGTPSTVPGGGYNQAGERIIAYRHHGDYFVGGLDMLGDRRAVTVTSITRARVAEIPRQALLALFNRYPEISQRFAQRLRLYQDSLGAAHTGVFEAVQPGGAIRSTEHAMSSADARMGLHMLVDDGVVEGTEVLVIDLDRCIHCGECEEACKRRHGHSRVNRKGMVVGNLSIASACRQCQDPVCMLCSRAGIARLPGGEVYITESCIGCGICAERCPYDNISIITLAEQKQQSATSSPWDQVTSFTSLFKKGIGKEYGRYTPDRWLPMASTTGAIGMPAKPLDIQQPLDAYGELLKKVAIKCDLCAGYENQACIQACPTGATFRTQPISFFGSTEEILRRVTH